MVKQLPQGRAETEGMLLDLIQSHFPIEARPYQVIGHTLHITGSEALDSVRKLVEEGLIRKIGPFFDSRCLGFKSTLVASRVAPEMVDSVAPFINEYREVTHNYVRAHRYNLWFTLIAPDESRIGAITDEIIKREGVLEINNLPALKKFKLNVDLSITGHRKRQNRSGTGTAAPVDLEEREKKLIKVIQNGIPIEEEPYEALARELSEESEWIMRKIKEWMSHGVIRRFGAALSHTRVGFSCNAMVVWPLNPEDDERIGRLFARNQHVSHCYIRPAFDGFPYNLYTMIHGHSLQEIDGIIKSLQRISGFRDYQSLASLEEKKKSSPVYF
jgi:siroheme decarboxylase